MVGITLIFPSHSATSTTDFLTSMFLDLLYICGLEYTVVIQQSHHKSVFFICLEGLNVM